MPIEKEKPDGERAALARARPAAGELDLDTLCTLFLDAYAKHADLFRSARVAGFNQQLFEHVIRALGLLNYENERVSGERWFLTALLSRLPDPIVIDVGANIGGYAELVKSIAPGAVVHAFEPSPAAYARLRDRADCTGFAAYNMGCSDRPG